VGVNAEKSILQHVLLPVIGGGLHQNIAPMQVPMLKIAGLGEM